MSVELFFAIRPVGPEEMAPQPPPVSVVPQGCGAISAVGQNPQRGSPTSLPRGISAQWMFHRPVDLRTLHNSGTSFHLRRAAPGPHRPHRPAVSQSPKRANSSEGHSGEVSKLVDGN